MARGRMLNNKVSQSLQFDRLPDDTCRLLATWTISHLDVNGVFYADPAVVRSLVFTRRTDVSADDVAGYLDAMEDVGLIRRYEANGDTWQVWPGFQENQPGLRADRETPLYPKPPAENPPHDPHESEPQPASNPAPIPPESREARETRGQNDGKHPAEVKLSEVETESSANADADARDPPLPESDEKPQKQLTGRSRIRSDLADWFKDTFSIPQPTGRGKYKELNKLWWTPLLRLYDLCDKDFEATKELVVHTVKVMDSEKLTISSPLSTINTAVSEHAKVLRGASRGDGRSGKPTNLERSLSEAMELLEEEGEWQP